MLLFDTRETPRANYKIIFNFLGPYTDRPVIRELKIDMLGKFRPTKSIITVVNQTDSSPEILDIAVEQQHQDQLLTAEFLVKS